MTFTTPKDAYAIFAMLIIGNRLRDCGEDMLMDVSEVLFNELAIFKIMKGCEGYVIGTMLLFHCVFVILLIDIHSLSFSVCGCGCAFFFL